MRINYKKSFEKLVQQIKFEYSLAENGLKDAFGQGMIFAYGSINMLAEKLEKGEFDFEDYFQGYHREWNKEF